LTTALWVKEHYPDREFEYFFSDVGAELPETYQWLDEIEEKQDIEIKRIGKDLEDRIEHHGILPSFNARFCTRETKIEPMEEYLGDDPAILYYGLRADEEHRAGYDGNKDNVEVKLPLQEAGIDIKGVWTILENQGLLPPSFHWPRLKDEVENILGPERKWKETWGIPPLRDWERHTLFAGRSRSNCHFCFYQRQYEWMWLHDEHKDLWDNAVRMEEEIGGDDYTWSSQHSLEELLERKDEIVERRANEVAEMISDRSQQELFGDEVTTIDKTFCGMHCGK
jgi:3'-phosphoadenosine 5'-phosphosulfate sulfotransferase (PAPS reductase)/FAD synthetase